ncbi:hypothetical protein [Paenibacillus agaridevorans]|uniref:hypothetical protein n=1 Tax=Paenibacillus agaridevorans TaxID=171404 RepID=UPI001BE42279|nr:hypothetical protein [Paenibacillus agaridevorans]
MADVLPFPRLSLAKVSTNSVHDRHNLVTIRNMARPYEDERPTWSGATSPQWNVLIDRIVAARCAGKPVIWSMGAHVIKNGLSRYVIELVRNGVITHVSGNGATSIHDFELAFLGETSEDVAQSIEDGSFGMWEETGRYMNEAIRQGSATGLGYGESLHRYLSTHPERFPYYDDCVFVQCQQFGVPYTCHISIGTDIIHQHPIADYEALGQASGRDFRTMCQSIAGLSEGGVFLNFGSAISGPEIFLKAVSMARNTGLGMKGITAANFDIVPAEAGRKPPETSSDYYYRPRRNFVDRLGQIDGTGYLFQGLHQETIPALFHTVLDRIKEHSLTFRPVDREAAPKLERERMQLFPIAERNSKFRLGSAVSVHRQLSEEYAPPLFAEMAERLRESKKNGKPLLVSLGGNVPGSGTTAAIGELVRQGMIDHVAVNGAYAFQDLELAAFGHTEEDSSGALSNGRLGMWREPSEIVNEALAAGYPLGLGYGESLIAYVQQHTEKFPFLAHSLIGSCIDGGIPYTVHITIGTDAVQQHPDADFRQQGGASGRDFLIYCSTVSQLEGGAFLNFGSTVIGPEVFLKALSIVRNLQHTVKNITTANFDIVKLGNYHMKVGYEDWDYYYRPRKNIIHRPTSLGGKGYHFEGMHQETIPALAKQLLRDVNGREEHI